ncbi:hypothetical protein R4Z10_12970 [Niallia sp. XMNu-256]|uniref:hypothetical protein n=1 Tax=Niallia sp. XMNu-256 TaxID=3082444 RepID=UPI0030D357DE
MSLEKNKKVLFVVGPNQELDYGDIKRRYHFLPEEIVVLESDEINRLQPYGDLMRDILLQIYGRNIEEIFIINKIKEPNDEEEILEKVKEVLDLEKNNSTVDYLFKYCKNEYPNRTLKEWLIENHRSIEPKQNISEVICSHPLMPDSIKVRELRV